MNENLCSASCGAQSLDYCHVCGGRFVFRDGQCTACGTSKGKGFPVPFMPQESVAASADTQ